MFLNKLLHFPFSLLGPDNDSEIFVFSVGDHNHAQIYHLGVLAGISNVSDSLSPSSLVFDL